MDKITLIEHSGEFDNSKIEELLIESKRILNKTKAEFIVKKRLFNILVESLDNIKKHSTHDEKDDGLDNYTSSFKLNIDDDYFYVESKNPILNFELPALELKIKEVNNLDLPGLKEKYEKILKQGKLSDRGGAGLGLVDMAIRTGGNKLNYKIEEINKDCSFFTLIVTIKKSLE